MKKIFDLPVCGYDRAKSFYGKAKVIETDNGEKVLQSYNTFVCRITAAGRFVRMWGGYSVTTMRHVNSFLSFYDMNGGGKAWWNGLPVERPHRTGENPVYIYDAAGKIIGHKIGNGKTV